MKAKLLNIFRSRPVFLLLLPLFYMLHELNRNYAPGLTATALLQVCIYTAIAVVFTFLVSFLLKSFQKAAIITLLLLLFNFFFGTVHDIIRKKFGVSFFLSRYTVILAALLIVLIIVFTWLKKSKPKLDRFFLFLHVLLPVLILLELFTLLPKILKKDPYSKPALSSQFISCDSCRKPDVYVIIADEYAGKQELQEVFSFDDSAFYSALQSRGFHVVNNSTSNYNATVYSMASLFNMDYIELSGKNLVTQGDMLLCRNIINNNSVGHFFQNNGYSIHNFSFFDVQGQRKAITNYYFHPRSRILNFGTFVNRFQRDVLPNYFSQKKWEAVEKNDYNNDETVDSLLRKLVTGKTGKPRFVYTHFTRPHQPYYVDRNGNFVNTWYNPRLGFEPIKKAYVDHVLYTNKRLLQLIDLILDKSAQPPVILLASDHGFRQFPGMGEKKYYFMNLCSVYLPGGNYENFYDGLTPVNTFRVILNSQFGQRFPILKDSTSFLVEK